MKSFSGYLKQEFGNNYVLLAGGGEKLLSDFAMANAYLPLSGGTMTGPIYFGNAAAEANILCYDASYPNHGIHYFDDTVDKLTISASGNANSISGADLCINGAGDGTVTIRGNTIVHSGNISSYIGSNLNQVQFSASSNTVGAWKTAIANTDIFYPGKWTQVGYNFISQFNNESYGDPGGSGNYVIFNIGGYPGNSSYNQFLVSCHSNMEVGVIGRLNDSWTGPRWFVYKDDIRNSNNYLIPETWIQFNGYYGLYSPNNNAHFLPNNITPYGAWRLSGSRGGYSGIHFGDDIGYMTIMDNHNDKGAYEEDWGWIWYFNRANKTLGLRTSNNSSFAVTCEGDFYCRNGWLRTNGERGWYNQSYGGGWYMLDTIYMRNYNNKIIYNEVGNNALGGGTHNLAFLCYNANHVSMGMHVSNCSWYICANSDTNFYISYRPNGSWSPSGDSYPVYISPSGSIYVNSDARLKKDITKISIDSLNELFNVSDNLLKSYTWKNTNKPSFGFIALELEEYIPEAVNEDINNIKHVSYNVAYAKIIASLIYKIKDLENRIKQLEN